MHDKDARLDGPTTVYFKNHPRMMGVLFTALLLLAGAGNAAAAAGGTVS